jgi:HSP20 family protein
LVTDFLHQDAADLADDARRLLTDLDRQVPGAAAASGECRPPLDVLETSDAVEVVVDVPGMTAESLRVAIHRDSVLVVGAKLGPAAAPTTRFHLAERSYGRFARVVRLSGAIDSSRAKAAVAAGQLRIIVPRIEDRRGRTIDVPVERG